jgi:predicted TIM-barrel fold metal-dependent hydrolase
MEILAKGGIGFGELTAEHFSLRNDHPYESAPPDHPLFLLLSDIAAQHGVPLDIHMEAIAEDMPLPQKRRFESSNNPQILKGNLAAFQRLLVHNRKTKIIWDHVGWCNTGQRTPQLCSDLLEKHPNLFMSFKIRPDSMPGTKPLTEDFRLKPEWLKLIQAYPDRFIIGSDQFYMPPKAQGQIGPPRGKKMETAQLLSLLPPDLARKVGHENAVQIFKLAL